MRAGAGGRRGFSTSQALAVGADLLPLLDQFGALRGALDQPLRQTEPDRHPVEQKSCETVERPGSRGTLRDFALCGQENFGQWLRETRCAIF